MTKADIGKLGIASWTVFGVIAIMLESVVRLTRVAVGVVREGLTISEWAALAVGVVVMGYVEGYRAFSRSFAPSVVERAFDLGAEPSVARIVLGPMYAMSLLGDRPRRVARSWALVACIVGMVVVVRLLPSTWRGIVDASVAVSLTWGTVAIGAAWGRRVWRELEAARAFAPLRAARPSQAPGAPR